MNSKRVIDLVIAIPAFLFFSPAIIFIAFLIRIMMGPSVFFHQKRPGLYGKPFKIYKFRTMSKSFDKCGRPLTDRERITRLGKILRTASLDELPELFNVVRGDMSIVGPRPLLMQYLERYSPEQARRHEVKPGITGWAQVNGRNAITWGQKFEYDVWYVDNQSLRLDLKIIMLTIWKTLKREGISQPGQVTTEEFKGAY